MLLATHHLLHSDLSFGVVSVVIWAGVWSLWVLFYVLLLPLSKFKSPTWVIRIATTVIGVIHSIGLITLVNHFLAYISIIELKCALIGWLVGVIVICPHRINSLLLIPYLRLHCCLGVLYPKFFINKLKI